MKLYIFSGATPERHYKDIYEKSFKLWKKEWEKTYSHDFKEKKIFFADEFTRQNFWIVLCIDSEPVGMVSIRQISFQNPIIQHDSWFRFFPKSDLSTFIEKQSPNCLISSNFVVKEEFRKSNSKHKISECIAQLNSLFALELGFNIHFGCSNNSRSVDKIVAATGARILSKAIPYKNGVELNSFYWTEEDMRKTVPNYPITSMRIFKEKIDFTLLTKDQNEYTKKAG
ncbi:MAG: hypothetical protein VX642_06540 [Bdellovibrionota bacterium]|nr:hypothetical protein [Bdellovibrionota bacterium]